MSVTCIILCAGDGLRWANHLGTPKHLVSIEGERLLDRTVRLIQRNLPHATIHTIVRSVSPDYYSPPAIQTAANLNAANGEADKFLSSAALWNRAGRTIVFYGDVWFSDDAMVRITDWAGGWRLFAREGASEFTGRQWGECFAQVFQPEDIAEHEAALHRLVWMHQAGEIARCGGWEHYRLMAGIPVDEHRVAGRFIEVNDWTDDFDTPEDLAAWLTRRKAAQCISG